MSVTDALSSMRAAHSARAAQLLAAYTPTPAVAPAAAVPVAEPPYAASSSMGGGEKGLGAGPFFDPASSTAEKGRHKVSDPRDFEADSIRCVADTDTPAVTLVTGQRRRRFQDGGNATGATAGVEVVAVLFDRDHFKSEEEARRWWTSNRYRIER